MLDKVHDAFNKMAGAFQEAEDRTKKAVLIASSLLPKATPADVAETAGHLLILSDHNLDNMVDKVKAHGHLSPLNSTEMDEIAKTVRKIVWKDEDITKPQGGTDGNAD